MCKICSLKCGGVHSKESVKELEDAIQSQNTTKVKSTYQSELDVTQELEASDTSYYQSIIGVLRWIVKLGCVDICLEVSMMSLHLVPPKRGHLDQVIEIFVYLKKYHNTKLVYDPSNPVVDNEKFER